MEYPQRHEFDHRLMMNMVQRGGGALRTTIALDDELVARAQELTGERKTSALVREALKALIEREAARRLILLGGSDPDAEGSPRRRLDPA